MKTTRLRRKSPPCLDRTADRAVITAVLLAVAVVLLLIGFSGPSEYLTLPGPMGWLYISVVISVAAAALVMLSYVGEKRKGRKSSALRTNNSRSKLSSLR